MVMKKHAYICREIQNDHTLSIFYGQNPLEYSFPLILIELSSLLVISRVIRFLLKPLRQPMVVSEILGGIILGPSVLSRNEKFRAYMFPDNAEYVISNLAVIGFMYFLFIAGVKMDLTAVRRVDKRHWYIAVVGIFVPLVSSAVAAYIGRSSLDKEVGAHTSIWGIAASLAITSFPVLYPIVKELNLVSSEIGRMALSTALIADIVGINGVVVFEATKQGESRSIAALWYIISLIVISGSIIGGIRQLMLWIVRNTPEGKPVGQVYVILILLGVMTVGFVTDMFGLAVANGPLWLGLAVPDGPPLGETLVEKTEAIMMNILIPFSFMYVGMVTDVSILSSHWSSLQPLLFMVLAGYLTKMASTLFVSRFFDFTLRDSLTLSLMMSLRGEVELLLFMHWMNFRIIGQPHFTVLVLLTLSVTALATPLISILYDPTRPYMVTKRRTIQHNPPNTSLHVVACIHVEEDLRRLMHFLELSDTSSRNPFSVYVLRLVELVGRAYPVFIDHEEGGADDRADRSSFKRHVLNACRKFQEAKGDCVSMRLYTTITQKGSMYQDICQLALLKNASLIVLPHCNKPDNARRVKKPKDGVLPTSSNVLKHAPCSVGFFVENAPPYQNYLGAMRGSMNQFVVLFLGGADAREALSYGDRLSYNSCNSLTVIRFLSEDGIGDDEAEKKLDDALVTWFWVKHEGNERVVYREVVVRSGEDTISAVREMDKWRYDLWIVGRKNGINPVLLQGLSSWSSDSEIGVVGEFLASSDFGCRGCVLSLQQQVLRGQQKRTSCSWFEMC